MLRVDLNFLLSCLKMVSEQLHSLPNTVQEWCLKLKEPIELHSFKKSNGGIVFKALLEVSSSVAHYFHLFIQIWHDESICTA